MSSSPSNSRDEADSRNTLRSGGEPDRRVLLRESITRQVWIGAAIACTGVVATIVWVFMSLETPSTIHFKLLVLGTIVCGLVLFVGFQSARWNRACRRAAALQGLMCPHCGYTLLRGGTTTSPDGHSHILCPECGLRLSMSRLREHWGLVRSAM